MPAYITIPRSEYEALLKQVRQGVDVCDQISKLRLKLKSVEDVIPITELDAFELVREAVIECNSVARLRVDLVALERRLREFDQELTPVRPASSADIKAAFDNSVDYAQGKKKPP